MCVWYPIGFLKVYMQFAVVNFLCRQEAQDLLHDLAVRKQGGSRGASPAPALSGSPCSPRRRRLTKTPSPDLATVAKDRKWCNYLICLRVLVFLRFLLI